MILVNKLSESSTRFFSKFCWCFCLYIFSLIIFLYLSIFLSFFLLLSSFSFEKRKPRKCDSLVVVVIISMKGPSSLFDGVCHSCMFTIFIHSVWPVLYITCVTLTFKRTFFKVKQSPEAAEHWHLLVIMFHFIQSLICLLCRDLFASVQDKDLKQINSLPFSFIQGAAEPSLHFVFSKKIVTQFQTSLNFSAETMYYISEWNSFWMETHIPAENSGNENSESDWLGIVLTMDQSIWITLSPFRHASN